MGNLTTAIIDVANERKRQIDAGYDDAHDDAHSQGQIIREPWGALGRLNAASRAIVRADFPVETLRNLLVQSAAMIVAEIERLDRLHRVTLPDDDKSEGGA